MLRQIADNIAIQVRTTKINFGLVKSQKTHEEGRKFIKKIRTKANEMLSV